MSLETFRRKLTENISLCVPEGDIKKYEIEKQGPEKVFQFRESLLSLMFKVKDFKTLYNMVIASFIILTFTLILSNFE